MFEVHLEDLTDILDGGDLSSHEAGSKLSPSLRGLRRHGYTSAHDAPSV